MNYDLKIIKDNYGEKMMHLCRELFPTLLEKEGLLSSFILKKFNPSRFLYEDIVQQDKISDFKNYVYNLVNIEKNKSINTLKKPKELLEEAGYDLYECKTEEDIQSFKKYYQKEEELCTFNGGRLDRCYVFFALKKDVDMIQRKNFKRPIRDDLYGTSVMSIQFTKGNINTLSIKNRYNHTVNNPDATLSNNLENIIPGLTESFERVYNLNINQIETNDFELQNYVKASDGKYYKYNYELSNIYYCPDNIIIDNFEVKKFPKERYVILDYFVLDLKEKKIYNYEENIHDSFPTGIKNIEKINIIKENDNKIINILTNEKDTIIIKLDKYNKIISYKNDELNKLENNFLRYNRYLIDLDARNVEFIGNSCLEYNDSMREINFPKLKKIEQYFLMNNFGLEKVNLPNLEIAGRYFLYKNKGLSTVDFPSLKYAEDYFLYNNEDIEFINFPVLEEVGVDFLNSNRQLTHVNFPKLNFIQNGFISSNKKIQKVNFPELVTIGDGFLRGNKNLTTIELPKVEEIGIQFMNVNDVLERIYLPIVIKIGSSFLRLNTTLKSIKLPKVKYIFDSFLSNNKNISEVDLPLLEEIEWHFLFECNNLAYFNFPRLNNKSKEILKNQLYYRAEDQKEPYGDLVYDSPIKEIKKENYIIKFINKLFKKDENSLGGNHIK